MATSSKVTVGTKATIASAGTPVTPTQAPYDNTHTIIIYNPDSTNTVYAEFVASGDTLTADTAMWIAPSGSLTLAIGAKSVRPPIGTLYFDASAGTPTVRITYVNGLSS